MSVHGCPPEGVPLPAHGRVDRRPARRRARRGQAGDRDHAAARLPRHRSGDLEPGGLLRRRRGLVPRGHLHRARRPRRPRVHAARRRRRRRRAASATTDASASRGILLRIEIETDGRGRSTCARRAGRGDLPRVRVARPARRDWSWRWPHARFDEPPSRSCGAPSSRASTRAGTSTSTTRAPASTPTRSSPSTSRSCAATSSATRTPSNPTSAAMTELVESARRGGARVLPRLAGRVRRDLHAERDGRAAARRRGVSVPGGRPLPPHLRQPQLRQRHPRVRARTRRRDDVRPEPRPGAARRRGAARRGTSPTSAASTTTCSRIRRSRTSPASSTRSSGSSRRTSTAGTCCSTRPRSCRRTASTSRASGPDFVVLSFYKMFGWPTGVGALIARRDALAKLERPWFSGGTIVAAFVQREWYQSAPGAAHFEDGTVELPQPARGRDRPSPPRPHRHRRDPRPRRGARRARCSRR